MFDTSCIHIFTIEGDTALYAMIDEAIVTEAFAGLTQTQKNVVNSRRYIPTQQQIDDGLIPQWAGNDPPAVYFRATLSNMKVALAKRWREPGALIIERNN